MPFFLSSRFEKVRNLTYNELIKILRDNSEEKLAGKQNINSTEFVGVGIEG